MSRRLTIFRVPKARIPRPLFRFLHCPRQRERLLNGVQYSRLNVGKEVAQNGKKQLSIERILTKSSGVYANRRHLAERGTFCGESGRPLKNNAFALSLISAAVCFA
jgi:hypothetical protein